MKRKIYLKKQDLLFYHDKQNNKRMKNLVNNFSLLICARVDIS